jgi:hypothetical protein
MKTLVVVSTVALGTAAVLFVGGWGLNSCQQRGWESMLDGPFPGAPYTGGITTAPTSVVRIPSGGHLEAHEPPASTNAIVVLRSQDGRIEWAHVLLPEKTFDDGITRTTWVRQLRLDRVQRRKSGWAIFVMCDWGWGGREGGIIYLDPAGNFQKFGLSW